MRRVSSKRLRAGPVFFFFYTALEKNVNSSCSSQFPHFFFFFVYFLNRLSSAQSKALYSVCVSFLFSGAGEVLQTALFEMVNSML